MQIGVPDNNATFLTPKIAVVGVGGAGTNAVNNMIKEKLEGIDFVVANTDAQDLNTALTEQKIQLGIKKTMGLGAGARPDVGRESAIESEDKIREILEGFHMVFITAGMGGGTGTGAAPVVAKIAKEMGILTVAFATKPFMFEGTKRMKIADQGIKELSEVVDSLIIVPNQKLFCVAEKGMKFSDSFKKVDNVLYLGVKSITDLMLSPGLINLDFADVRTTMENMGMAMMGTGSAMGDNRALIAVENAMLNPLLDCSSMKGANKILVNIQGAMELDEVDAAMNRIYEEASEDAEIIFGSSYGNENDENIVVSIVATGLQQSASSIPQQIRRTENVTMPMQMTEQNESAEEHDEPEIVNIEIPSAPAVIENIIRLEEKQQQQQENKENAASSAIPAMPNAQSYFSTINGVGVKSEEFTPKIVNIGRDIKPPVIFVPAVDDVPQRDDVELIDDDFFDGENSRRQEKPKKTSLFDRITKASHKSEEKPRMAAANGFAASPEDRSVSSFDDNGLDIPTFLRR